MARIVDVRKNVVVSGHIANDDDVSFTREINNVTFIPDEVIVKMITFNSRSALPEYDYDTNEEIPPDANNKVINIFTNLVDDGYIGSITDVGVCCPGFIFTLKRPVIGEYNFQFFDTNREPFNFKGDISIHLEFVKYVN